MIVLRLILVALLTCSGALFPPFPRPALAGQTYTVAVIPNHPPAELSTNWGPVIARLEKETGLIFKLKLYRTMDDFESDIEKGAADFLFAHPFQAVEAHKAKGYIPLIRGSKTIGGTLFVRKDSPYRTVKDLEGKAIAFVGSQNVCSIFVRHLLTTGNTQVTFTPRYTGTTSNVFKNVILGKAAAGASLDVEVERLPKELLDQIRILLETEKTPPHPLMANPRVPREVQHSVASAVLKIANDAEGAAMLRKVRLGNPVRAEYGKDYRFLEKVNIKGLKRQAGDPATE